MFFLPLHPSQCCAACVQSASKQLISPTEKKLDAQTSTWTPMVIFLVPLSFLFLRSSRTCKFASCSACFCTRHQQCPLLLLHRRYQSHQHSRASPQSTLQLRGNHNQHHQAGLHWRVVRAPWINERPPIMKNIQSVNSLYLLLFHDNVINNVFIPLWVQA